uniref:hypothetical protein n=1 Tax=Janthinobacterium sp. TaxID=1871054 RepID=UPI00293D6753
MSQASNKPSSPFQILKSLVIPAVQAAPTVTEAPVKPQGGGQPRAPQEQAQRRPQGEGRAQEARAPRPQEGQEPRAPQ